MIKHLLVKILPALLMVSATAFCANAGERSQIFKIDDGCFTLDGKPFPVKAAELHYPRIPRPYWEHRIEMCKALGMNAVCLYVFWNAHEQHMDSYDFEGQNDLREFIKLCDKHGMKVILRPGPYVCAEWEMGGLPWWLLKKKDIDLRHSDPSFLERVDKFQQQVAGQVGDLTVADGGPIIMIQVENEYGSYGTDKPYVMAIRDMVRRNFGEKVPLFQCDWSSNFTENGLDDLLWTMNFGTGANVDHEFARLKQLRPTSPLMCSEFWSGWFDKWGASHETRPADEMVAGLDEMIDKGISFSLYMTHGGTNWGHWAGANSPGYAPDVTSYDYDAPINEQGYPTPKYFKLREMMQKHSGAPLPAVPDTIPTTEIPSFTFTEYAPLWDNLPPSRKDVEIKTMEEYDKGFGSILYRTSLPATPAGSTLTVSDPHDYAQIYLDGNLTATLDRRNGDKEVTLPSCNEGTLLDILVEAMGRINFGVAIKDFKGITDSVTVTRPDGTTARLTGWEVFNIDDELSTITAMNYIPLDSKAVTASPRMPQGAYRATFYLDKPADTFLDFSTWGKGLVWVNGHPLGRIWEIGPQQTLYMPGCWLKEGENEIIVFDILGPRKAETVGLKTPILDRLNLSGTTTRRYDGSNVDLSSAKLAAECDLKRINGWQTANFPAPSSGRYVALEINSCHDSDGVAAIAELHILDRDGNRLSREPWRVVYADSEDTATGNHTADKTFDLQESTSWQSSAGAPLPHLVIIDLGGEHDIYGLQYLPRMEADVPGAVKSLKVYCSQSPMIK